jgi:LPPG:FO 2-phospho-L-lactate transferase
MTRLLALCGGVGGAKLASGFADLLSGDELMVAVNTGDDFEHLGLTVCPDIDSTLYALAGLNDAQRGWGRADESWNFMAAVRQLQGPAWFQLGDRDLATHVLRSQRLREGATLSTVTDGLAKSLGIASRVLPMSDDPVRTCIETDEGRLAFQDYFVRQACRPRVRSIDYFGAAQARAQPEILHALQSPELQCVVLCPSNPWLSIGPLLAIPELEHALRARRVPLIAISPIVGGRALKGPADKIMRELGKDVSVSGIAEHYAGLIDTLVIDEQDRAEQAAVADQGVSAVVAQTVMRDDETRRHLARTVLAFAGVRSREAPCQEPGR